MNLYFYHICYHLNYNSINNNSPNYYGNNVLYGPGNPSVGNQVTQHVKTEKEREM